MIIPTKNLKNGFQIPVYGLGTWKMGASKADEEKDIQSIKNALDLGITHIDTAESYADGYCERIIGKAIRGYDRSKIFLVSKVFADHLGYDELIHAARASLTRMQTMYLDLYLTHRANPPGIPIEETMRAMDSLIEKGLVRNIGVSNYNVEQMQEAQSLAKNKIVTNQMHYNLKIREVEKKGVLRYCQENDILLTAYRPLQKGLLLNAPILEEIAKKYNKTPAQIAINWLISQDNVVTLSKTTNLDHLKENLGAVGWNMEKEDIGKLQREFPDQQDISNVVPLD